LLPIVCGNCEQLSKNFIYSQLPIDSQSFQHFMINSLKVRALDSWKSNKQINYKPVAEQLTVEWVG